MTDNFQEAINLIGHIRVHDMVQNEDGSWQVIFDYDEAFKKEYKRLFKLKRWSKKHFETQLDIAIKNFAEQVKTDKGLLELRQQILAMKEQ